MAAMNGRRTIISYKVGVSRAARPGPVRSLTLQLADGEGAISQVAIFFYEKQPSALGFVNRQTSFVNVNLPLVDFEPMYQVLNIEKPVFVHWRTDPEDERLASIDVSTSEEPVGEGPVDKSP
jgi:hypothetical protein